MWALRGPQGFQTYFAHQPTVPRPGRINRVEMASLHPTRRQGPGMTSDRWKKASLAIDAVIRGLELDQVVFQYDETACQEITSLVGARVSGASDGLTGMKGTSSLLRALSQHSRTTSAAYP